MDKLSKVELLKKCQELGITKCKSKTKSELIELIIKQESNTNEIIENEKLVRGTAYDAFNILKRFGLISRKDKYSPLVLSEQFSRALERLSKYWKTWVKETSSKK